jgi:hypothetical protein
MALTNEVQCQHELVDRSTTARDWPDVVETGWTERHVAGREQVFKTKTATLPRLGSRVRIPSSAPKKAQFRGGVLSIGQWTPDRQVYY